MSKILTNDRSGQSFTSDLTDEQAATKFTELFGDKQHWLWFWLHKACLDAPKVQAINNALQFLQHNFIVVRGYGLKNPMIRLHFGDRRYKIYLSKRGTVCLKSGQINPGTKEPVGDEHYVGALHNGRFLPPSDRPTPSPEEQEFVERLSQDPITFLAECSKDMGRCCYCNVALSDPRSKVIGYGKVCARNWGLPWGDKDYMEKAKTFSKAYAMAGSTLAGLIEAIVLQPTDRTRWLILSDALQDCGLPPFKDVDKAVATYLAKQAEKTAVSSGSFRGGRYARGYRRYA